MNSNKVDFTLSYSGKDADKFGIDFYDISQALIGFQRSLAITTHLVLNGQVITQAPSLKNANIIVTPPERGSWSITAVVVIISTALYKAGTAPKDTPLGNLVRSAYDYIVSQTLGFNVDYDSTLGQQYRKLKDSDKKIIPILEEGRFDSAIEKCEVAITNIHRPIVKTETAERANIYQGSGRNLTQVAQVLDRTTYEYISYSEESADVEFIQGRVSSYNINTFKGRVYVESENRSIPFELVGQMRTTSNVKKITRSLSDHPDNKRSGIFDLKCNVKIIRSRSGILKQYLILELF